MAEGLNRAMLIGNLGAEPELRYTQNNRAVLKFRIATTESYTPEGGERKEVTYWHNIVLWGKRAEALEKLLAKGSRVYVEGRIETRAYDDQNGVKRNITEITANNILLMDGRREAEDARKSKPAGDAPRNGGKPTRRETPALDDFGGPPPAGDDDIPF